MIKQQIFALEMDALTNRLQRLQLDNKSELYCMNFGDTQVCNFKNVPWCYTGRSFPAQFSWLLKNVCFVWSVL